MKREVIICDVCGKVPHLIFRQWEEGKVFCSVFCWKEWWGREWNGWLEERLTNNPKKVTQFPKVKKGKVV